jgi:hypothetical protein
MGIGTLLVVGIAEFALGGDPKMILSLLQTEMQKGQQGYSGSTRPVNTAFDNDDTKGVVGATLADLEDRWTELFAQKGARYQPAPLVLFRGGTNTGCGYGETAAGPFYCPLDKSVYLDLNFMDELQKLGGQGDFGLAYVVAHEVGHHVQNLISPDKMRARKSQQDSVATELQADCFAGVWAHFANKQRDFIEAGDIEEGLKTAAAVGDDHIQRSTTGRVHPESFTHGTSQQRIAAFSAGFQSGRLESCSFN